jgi:hypothetical protein
MRVRAPHQPVVAERIAIAADITGDHARGNPRGTHQHDERRAVVFAEPGLLFEQEFIDGMTPQQRRF